MPAYRLHKAPVPASRPIQLTPREHALLRLLIDIYPAYARPHAIYKAVADVRVSSDNNLVANTMNTLRTKLPGLFELARNPDGSRKMRGGWRLSPEYRDLGLTREEEEEVRSPRPKPRKTPKGAIHAIHTKDGLRLLSPAVYRLLAVLLAADGEVLTRGELEARMWPRERAVTPGYLDVLLSQLRRAVGPEVIETWPGSNRSKRGWYARRGLVELRGPTLAQLKH